MLLTFPVSSCPLHSCFYIPKKIIFYVTALHQYYLQSLLWPLPGRKANPKKVCLGGINWRTYEMFILWHNETKMERSKKVSGIVEPEGGQERYAGRRRGTYGREHMRHIA
jgi:hypothetical protein